MDSDPQEFLDSLDEEPTLPIEMLGKMVTLEEWIHSAYTRVRRARAQLEPSPETPIQVTESSRVNTNGETTPSEPTTPL